MPSLKLAEKLNRRLAPDDTVVDIMERLELATSRKAFSSQTDLQQFLMEGALLNIGKLSSKALSVPCGEYMVWVTDPGHTVLMATKPSQPEVYEHKSQSYEIFTHDLLNNWGTVEKTLNERFPAGGAMDDSPNEAPEGPESFGGDDEASDTQEKPKGDGKPTGKSPFPSKIQTQSVDRTPIVRAMEQHGHTVTSLAAAVGVQPPAISRILRHPKDTQGDPGGRNPSLGLAAKIAHELKMDAEAMFPDIFGIPTQDFQARKSPGNRGSGMKGAAAGSRKKGKASKAWTQGNNG